MRNAVTTCPHCGRLMTLIPNGGKTMAKYIYICPKCSRKLHKRVVRTVPVDDSRDPIMKSEIHTRSNRLQFI